MKVVRRVKCVDRYNTERAKAGSAFLYLGLAGRQVGKHVFIQRMKGDEYLRKVWMRFTEWKLRQLKRRT